MAFRSRHPLSGGVLTTVSRLYLVAGSQRESVSRGSGRAVKVVETLNGNQRRELSEFGIARGPKKPWGDGGPVVAERAKPSKRRGPGLNALRDTTPAGVLRLQQLRRDNEENPSLINKNVFQIVKDVDVLKLAYARIKSAPGNMTKGTTPETLDGISLEWFEKTSREIGSGTFKFLPARRVEIPKPNSTKTRPLGVGNPRQKIVQEAMRLVLEAIYEPSFSPLSHGFRANRGCHTALNHIKMTFGGVV